MEIGREHKACDQGCTKRGFGHPPDIGILDTDVPLEASRADPKGPKGRCWVEDLGSLNGTRCHTTAEGRTNVCPSSTATPHGRRCGRPRVQARRGPYMTIAFKGGRQGGGDQWREPSPGRVRVGTGIQSFERLMGRWGCSTWGGFGQLTRTASCDRGSDRIPVRGANTVALDGRRRDGRASSRDVASRIAVQSVAKPPAAPDKRDRHPAGDLSR